MAQPPTRLIISYNLLFPWDYTFYFYGINHILTININHILTIYYQPMEYDNHPELLDG